MMRRTSGGRADRAATDPMHFDAYHATGEEFYYRAAESVAAALIQGQDPSGGWNYLVDFAGDESLRQWYATVGAMPSGWGEFHHDYGNATFDDGGTAECSSFLPSTPPPPWKKRLPFQATVRRWKPMA